MARSARRRNHPEHTAKGLISIRQPIRSTNAAIVAVPANGCATDVCSDAALLEAKKIAIDLMVLYTRKWPASTSSPFRI
jgi:hypothetical protein